MSRNKKDVFKEVISKAEAQKPADDMAGLVMQQIRAETQDEVALNPALKKLLQQHAVDAAPMAFTVNVMAQVNPRTASTYAPLISKKVWFITSSVLGAVILMSALSSSGEHAFATSIGGNVIKQINAMPAVYIITLISGGLLLVLEHLITSRLKLTQQGSPRL